MTGGEFEKFNFNNNFSFSERIKPKAEKTITLQSIQEAPPLKEKQKYYLETLFLYKKGIESPLWTVRNGTAMALKELASINSEAYFDLLKKAAKDHEESVRYNAALSIQGLIPFEPRLAEFLYKKGMEINDEIIRAGVAGSLGALVAISPKLAGELYQKGIQDQAARVRAEVAANLKFLLPMNLELATELFQKGMDDFDDEVRINAIKNLSDLAFFNPDLALDYYKEGLKDPDWRIRNQTAKELEFLALVDKEAFLSLFKKAVADPNFSIKRSAMRGLRGLLVVDQQLAFSLYKENMQSPHWEVRAGVAEVLDDLATFNPDLFVSLYEQGLHDPDWSVRFRVAESLKRFVLIDPQRAVSFCKKGMDDFDATIRKGTAEALGNLVSIDLELAKSLFKQGAEDPDEGVRAATVNNLKYLILKDPELALSLYKKSFEDKSEEVKEAVLKNLGAVAYFNPQLAFSFYKEGIADFQWPIQRVAAESIGGILKGVLKNENGFIDLEFLKKITKTYLFSSKKKDKELFRNIAVFLKKEDIQPFLESENLPNSLKYEFKIAFLEKFSKEEIFEHFQKAVSDFNSALKREDSESLKARRIILEFLSRLPIHEASHYLATQAEKLIPKLGNLESIDMRLFKALADANTREGNRLLLSILYHPELPLRRKEYIFRKLIQNRVFEEGLLGYFGDTKESKLLFFQALEEFQKHFPKIIPNKTLFDLFFREGLSFSEIKEKSKEFKEQDISFDDLIEKLAKDRKLATIYFASFSSPYRYDNFLTFERFFWIVETASKIDHFNWELKKELRSLWEKQKRSAKEIEGFLKIIERGEFSYEVMVQGEEEEEIKKTKEVSFRAISNLAKNFVNLEPIFALCGRLLGLVKKDEVKTKEIQQKIAEVLDSLDSSLPNIFQKEKLVPLYQKLYEEYWKIFSAKGEKNIKSWEELYKEDQEKFLLLLQKDEVFLKDLSVNSQKDNKEIIQNVSENLIKRLKKYSKKYGEISEKFQILTGLLEQELEKSLENLSKETKLHPLRINFKYIPKFDFKEEKHLVEFLRLGDARESCIATDGLNFWTIPYYLKDFGTLGFLISDQDKAIGHIIAYLGKDDLENPVLLVNGIYLKAGYPFEIVGKKAADFLESFSQKIGLKEVLFASSSHADIIPSNYKKTKRVLQRLQGVEGKIYSDFGAPTDFLELVTCYEKETKASDDIK